MAPSVGRIHFGRPTSRNLERKFLQTWGGSYIFLDVDDRVRTRQLPGQSGDLTVQLLVALLLRSRRIDLRSTAYRDRRLVGLSQLLASPRQHRGIHPLLAQQCATLAGLLAPIVLAQYPAFVGSRNQAAALDGNHLRIGCVGGGSMRCLGSIDR